MLQYYIVIIVLINISSYYYWMLPLYPRAHGVLLLILLLSHEAHQQPKPAAGEEKVLKIEDVKVKQGICY